MESDEGVKQQTNRRKREQECSLVGFFHKEAEQLHLAVPVLLMGPNAKGG